MKSQKGCMIIPNILPNISKNDAWRSQKWCLTIVMHNFLDCFWYPKNYASRLAVQKSAKLHSKEPPRNNSHSHSLHIYGVGNIYLDKCIEINQEDIITFLKEQDVPHGSSYCPLALNWNAPLNCAPTKKIGVFKGYISIVPHFNDLDKKCPQNGS